MQYMENPSFHHAPEGYWDQENEKRKNTDLSAKRFGIKMHSLSVSEQQTHRQFSN